MSKEKLEKANRKLEILNKYTDLVESGTLFPTRADLKNIKITRDDVRYYFSNYQNLRAEAKIHKPKSFVGSIDLEEYLSDQNITNINNILKKYKRFVVTTAVSGQSIHYEFLRSIKLFCKLNKAKLLILPSHDPAHNLDNEIDWHFDPIISKETYIFEETRFNNNLFISGIRVTAKQINPITGLSEISQNQGSFISASPKQFLEYDAVSSNRLPHGRMTTGACTLPNYHTTKGNSLRMGYLAEKQHTVGALIVEIRDEEIFHQTQIQAADDGSFCHLGFEYKNNKRRKLSGDEAPVLVMGDYHAGEHDETAVGAWTEIINDLRVEEVVFHDLFNGISVNPHEEEDIMLRAERARKRLNVLEHELEITSNEIDRILGLKSIKRGIVVKSNHDDFIDRWLKKSKFAKDPVNYEFGIKLSFNIQEASRNGIKKDFFKTGLELVKKPKHFNKLRFLTTDEDYIVGGIHLGPHGDKGPNGSKGSIKSLAKAYPRCVIGHSHTPGIFKNVFQIGTSSLLRLGYNKGASSWVHCSCLVYRNGQRQLINSINGKWRL